MRILLWHVHGGWANAFVQGGHDYLLPTTPERGPWGLGRDGRDWPAHAVEVPMHQLSGSEPDVVLLQRPEEIAEVERLLGRRPGRDIAALYLEHNTPKAGVPNSVHALAGQREIPIVHVTHFNELFWDNGRAPATVIEHGIVDPGQLYTGERKQLGVVINEPVRRWRVTGTDLLPRFAETGHLEVFGIGTADLPARLGLSREQMSIGGDLPTAALHRQLAGSRVYLHPLRWTSLGLALLEAMHLGMPVLALAGTEAVRAVPPEAGAISTRVEDLCRAARRLLDDPEQAHRCGQIARLAALERYGLDTFLRRWDEVLEDTRSRFHAVHPVSGERKGS